MVGVNETMERMVTHRRFTFEQIDLRFSYDGEAGKLFRHHHSGRVGEMILAREWKGRIDVGQANFGGYSIFVTHIMFMLKTKRWPEPGLLIDYRDGDMWNCKWDNLRESTRRARADLHGEWSIEVRHKPSINNTP
jgi:hypothetical protein